MGSSDCATNDVCPEAYADNSCTTHQYSVVQTVPWTQVSTGRKQEVNNANIYI